MDYSGLFLSCCKINILNGISIFVSTCKSGNKKGLAFSARPLIYGVDDGARTHDNWNHNPGLYQLSYAHHNDNNYRNMVRPAGLEPATLGLEGRCSIQMSYGRIVCSKNWSGRRDSNSRHPAPKAGALPDCATPRLCWRALYISLYVMQALFTDLSHWPFQAQCGPDGTEKDLH